MTDSFNSLLNALELTLSNKTTTDKQKVETIENLVNYARLKQEEKLFNYGER